MATESELPRLQKRNVEVVDSDGAVIAGTSLRFWQYGTLQWDEFYRYMITFVVTTTAWTIFQFDTVQQRRAGEPIRIGLVPTLPRPRNPTHSNTPAHGSYYRTRGLARDGNGYSKGSPAKLPTLQTKPISGGRTKIDSVQNIQTITIAFTAFTNGNADLNGLYLQLDHIQDPTLRPLDELFTDHFMQGIFKHMKGTGEVGWSYEDYDEAFGDGSFNLSNVKIWDTEEGRKRFELALSDRLFDHRISQQG
ncbi:hypothetical protein EDB89DRAFT_1903156 [Lactarius sanguifluus]|nr:hypothetical protein EDB89DRAFT_1903156 [Lactarius sanguifluus]